MMNICKCGCGSEVKGIWKRGHNNIREEVFCLSCGVKLKIAPSRIADGRGKYCSRGCAKNGYNSKAKRPADRKNGHHRFLYQITAEKALGRPLKRGEVVHHIDGNPRNSNNTNLLICNQSYHRLLHSRQDAIKKGQICL